MSTFNDGVTVLMLGHPFYSQLLMKFKHVESRDIPTACISYDTLMYNPDFLEKLDDDECTFVVAHEVQHAVLEHLPMMKFYADSGVGPDGKVYSHDRMNRAMDFSVNGLLVEGGFTPIPESKFPICLDTKRYPTSMTSEEIYCKLPADEDGGGGGRSGGGGGGGKPLDQHVPGAAPGSNPADPAPAPVLQPSDIVAAAEHHRAVTGKYPAGVERILATLKKPAVSPWRRLRSAVLSHFPGAGRKTWRRLDRRMAPRGIFIPGNTSTGTGRIGIVADTSGSIDQKMLDFFGGHMAAIVDDARPREVIVYWCDAKVHDKGLCRTSSALRAYLGKGAKGGGGTDMTKGVRAAVEDKCDTIVVLTDGHTPFGDEQKTPVVWAITSKKVAPHGLTIHINE